MLKGDSHSIQQLLIAEQKALETIHLARKRKIQRFKEAKEEAFLESGKFKAEKEREYKEYELKYLGSQEKNAKKIEKDAEKLLMEMEKYVKLNKDTVIGYLLDLDFNINCEVHENFRPDVF